ncbi:class I SAM-dependent methyltransferase [Streptomyces sp. NPDC093094]|uniref:class I SAM-dependent methyltransferase n=1 Tax=Streptomyces sp. NPDC093094 TaxID=3366026 RepID=UPI00380F80A7
MPSVPTDPRRDDCPWCGSPSLRTRTKPGTLAVDECRDCAHVFQNPRHAPETRAAVRPDAPGRQAPGAQAARPDGARPDGVRPDGVRGDAVRGDGVRVDRVRAAVTRLRHRLAARAMLPFPEPESWLDVGTGHADFPETARAYFPYTAFDGVDATPRVERARAAGRVEEAHVGTLTAPAVLARLRARYDVVSLLHHLERTRDPRGELRAALAALRPGGHILIESTDPRRLPLPRLPHLLPPSNLRTELEAEGCELVTSPDPTLLTRSRLTRAYRMIARRSV